MKEKTNKIMEEINNSLKETQAKTNHSGEANSLNN